MDKLSSGQELKVGQSLISANGQYRLTFFSQHRLELQDRTNADRALWHAYPEIGIPEALVMRPDGELVIYKPDGRNSNDILWASRTAADSNQGAYLILQDDGNLVIYRANGKDAIWATHTNNCRYRLRTVGTNEQKLNTGQVLTSRNGKYTLKFSKLGSLQLWKNKTSSLLYETASDLVTKSIALKANGTVMLNDNRPGREIYWSSPVRSDSFELVVEDYGDLVLYDSTGKLLWSMFEIDTSNWMSKLDGRYPLKQYCIPGSHDAGMYQSSLNVSLIPEINAIATELGSLIAKTQGKSLFEQLKLGVRYFDLRPKDSLFHVYHGPALGPLLKDILQDVKSFIENEGKNETVLLNFSHFEGNFNDKNSITNNGFLYLINEAFNPENLIDLEQFKDGSGQYLYKTLFEIPLEYLRGKVLLIIEGDGQGRELYDRSVNGRKAVIGKALHTIFYRGALSDLKRFKALSAGDFVDLYTFTLDLIKQQDALSKYLMGRIPPENQISQKNIGNYHKMVPALNQILMSEPCIYAPDRFAAVALSAETQKLLALNPSGEDCFRLNYMLITDAYPTHIRWESQVKTKEYTLNIFDHWADKEDYHQMASDQKGKFENFSNNSELFLLNYTLTSSQSAIEADMKKLTGSSDPGLWSYVSTAAKEIFNVANSNSNLLAKVKEVLTKHGVQTFANQINPRLLGDFADHQFIYSPNRHRQIVNIINTDFVESAQAVRASLRVNSNNPRLHYFDVVGNTSGEGQFFELRNDGFSNLKSIKTLVIQRHLLWIGLVDVQDKISETTPFMEYDDLIKELPQESSTQLIHLNDKAQITKVKIGYWPEEIHPDKGISYLELTLNRDPANIVEVGTMATNLHYIEQEAPESCFLVGCHGFTETIEVAGGRNKGKRIHIIRGLGFIVNENL